MTQTKQRNGADAKAEKRERLIRSTMKCIANQGMSSVTMASVTQDAGVSMGLANLHFKSKEGLLNETLAYVHDQYVSGLERIASKQQNSPADHLLEQVKWDFSSKVANRELLAVWFAFWGEAKSRPTYRQVCSERDSLMTDRVQQLCQQLIDEGDYPGYDAEDIAIGLCCLIEGLWLDMLIAPQKVSRERAHRVAVNYLATNFPKHISRASK